MRWSGAWELWAQFLMYLSDSDAYAYERERESNFHAPTCVCGICTLFFKRVRAANYHAPTCVCGICALFFRDSGAVRAGAWTGSSNANARGVCDAAAVVRDRRRHRGEACMAQRHKGVAASEPEHTTSHRHRRSEACVAQRHKGVAASEPDNAASHRNTRSEARMAQLQQLKKCSWRDSNPKALPEARMTQRQQLKKCSWRDSNPQPPPHKSGALTVKLQEPCQTESCSLWADI